MRAFASWLALGLLAAKSNAAPFQTSSIKRDDASGKLVFAHFMVGIMEVRESAADYDEDMQKAKAAGIDAFALNIATDAVDSYTDTQLGYAYESAANNGMQVFISFDYAYYATSDNTAAGEKIKKYAGEPAQLKIGGKPFASTFNGDADGGHLFNAAEIRAAAGDVYLVPNLSPHNTATASTKVDDIEGALNWMAWPSNGGNRAPTADANVSVAQGDNDYKTWLNGKQYLAPVSPWFFTHFGSKNWVMPGNSLWYDRWNEILDLAPAFVEILTWNDYGESHYIGPIGKHTDDGSGAWTQNMPHEGWLEMAAPYIAAYKAGEKAPTISEEKLIYWYRPYPKSAGCSDSIGVPEGTDSYEDAVYVVAMLKEEGDVTVTSGSNTQTFKAPAGANIYHVAMGDGKPTFSLARGSTVLSGTGDLAISSDCSAGVNFNAFVGSVTGTDSAVSPPSSSASGVASNVTAVATSNSVVTSVSTSSSSSSAVVVKSTPSATSATIIQASSSSAVAPISSIVATPTVVQQGAGGCSVTITASAQIFPTNCLAAGQVWGGEGATPDCCDGQVCC